MQNLWPQSHKLYTTKLAQQLFKPSTLLSSSAIAASDTLHSDLG